jgi:1-deoxy-D-xylulose-5-phosphate synthase
MPGPQRNVSGLQPLLERSAVNTTTQAPDALLKSINSPADLRRLSPARLNELAEQLRRYLVQSVAHSGGHLAAGLGTVELTIALHAVFNTPDDALVWDVGHQCYPHKVLTGRREQLASIRQRDGISGFLRRDESDYDSFGAGHSSTSISAALGMAIANSLQGNDRKTAAIIGDGGITAGLAYEALNHAGTLDVDLMVVLNDNHMSISPNVGALNNYLRRLRASTRKIIDKLPALWAFHERSERMSRGMVIPGQWFEDLGFSYVGPVDGHDLPNLMRVMREVRSMTGPRILHVVTNKGHGYAPAAADPVKYHGVTPFNPELGIRSEATSSSTITSTSAPTSTATYTQVFGDWVCDMAKQDARLVAITPAMREGSGLVKFEQQFPDRYFDVAIAEQHSVTFAAGLAAQGMKPVVAIYSTFLQRGYDQLIHDVAIQKLPVLFAIDRAGLVGPDGATHTGSFDLSFMRCIPNLTIMAPVDGVELRNMLYTGFMHDGPVAVRYPRATSNELPDASMHTLPIGVAETRRIGKSIALLVFGTLLPTAMQVAETLNATVINMRYIKPLDVDMIKAMANSHDLLVTLEENSIAGGAGSAVNECLAANGLTVNILNLGLPDQNPEHGTRAEALQDAGLDYESILAAIQRRRALAEPARRMSRPINKIGR